MLWMGSFLMVIARPAVNLCGQCFGPWRIGLICGNHVNKIAEPAHKKPEPVHHILDL